MRSSAMRRTRNPPSPTKAHLTARYVPRIDRGQRAARVSNEAIQDIRLSLPEAPRTGNASPRRD